MLGKTAHITYVYTHVLLTQVCLMFLAVTLESLESSESLEKQITSLRHKQVLPLGKQMLYNVV